MSDELVKKRFPMRLDDLQRADCTLAAQLETRRLKRTVTSSELLRDVGMRGVYEILRSNGRTPKSEPAPVAVAVAEV